MSSTREHLDGVNEGYFEHMGHAMSYSLRLIKASGACFIHAFIPSRCACTASTEIRTLHEEITARQSGEKH